MNIQGLRHENEDTTTPIRAISLTPDILKVLEETREGAMEELEDINMKEESEGEGSSNRPLNEFEIKELRDDILQMISMLDNKSARALEEKIISTGILTSEHDGINALTIAAGNWKIKMMKRLIDYGFDVNIKIKGKNLLFYAYEVYNMNVMIVLIKGGIDINVELMNGMNFLHINANNGNKGIVKFLLQHNVDINSQCNSKISSMDKSTALILAAKEGHKEVVKLLLDAGANPNIRDAYHNTAYDYAGMRGHKEIQKMVGENPNFRFDMRALVRNSIWKLGNLLDIGSSAEH